MEPPRLVTSLSKWSLPLPSFILSLSSSRQLSHGHASSVAVWASGTSGEYYLKVQHFSRVRHQWFKLMVFNCRWESWVASSLKYVPRHVAISVSLESYPGLITVQAMYTLTILSGK